MSHFQTRVKNFFAIRENLLPRRPCGHGQFVGANGFMRLFDHTVKLFSAKERSAVAGPSKSRLHVGALFFNQLFFSIGRPAKNVKHLMPFFMKYAARVTIPPILQTVVPAGPGNVLPGKGAGPSRRGQCLSRCHMMKKTEPTVMLQARSILQVSISPPSSQPRKMPITGTTYS